MMLQRLSNWSCALAVVSCLLTTGYGHPWQKRSRVTPARKPATLHAAAEAGDIATVTKFIKRGARINAKDRHGATPLHYAAAKGHTAVALLLLEKGAIPDVRDKNGHSSLHYAAKEGHADLVQLLAEKGADVNSKASHDLTALHLAAEEGYRAVAELLLMKGAEIDAKTSPEGMTPLHLAARGGQKEVVELLLNKGADVNAKTYTGTTSLHMAALHGHKSVIELLVQSKAELNPHSDQGETPIDMANQSGHTEVALMLSEAIHQEKIRIAEEEKQQQMFNNLPKEEGIYIYNDNNYVQLGSEAGRPISEVTDHPSGAKRRTRWNYDAAYPGMETWLAPLNSTAIITMGTAQPEFIFYFKSLTATDIKDRYFLVLLEWRENMRTLRLERRSKIYSTTFVPVSSGWKEFRVENLDSRYPEYFRVSPAVDLEAGEYAFYMSGAPFGPGESYSKALVWTFRVYAK